VSCDDFAGAGDHHFMHVALHPDRAMPILRRHGVVVALIVNQRQRTDAGRDFLAGLIRRRRQRQHAQLRRPHVVLHDRVAARELMLFSEPIEYPLGRMPLLGRPPLVIVQNGVDDAYPRPKLRPPDRLLSLVAWWHRVLQHLPNHLSRHSPNSLATARRLRPSTRTAQRTRP
jgi:hypothetical protein